MGCGASAKETKYSQGSAATPAPAQGGDGKATATGTGSGATKPDEKMPKPALKASGSQGESSQSSKGLKRRPSFEGEVEISAANHEGHGLKKEGDDGPTVQRQRQSKVVTNMELWWMTDIPKMYSVTDSDELREDLQEDAQADKVKECTAKGVDVAALLRAWLHDCPADARERFIQRVIDEVNTINYEAKKAKAVAFNEGGESEAKRSLQRKGTGFVTATQVRSLMAADYADSDEESSEGGQDDEEFERQCLANIEKSQNVARIAVSAERHEAADGWKPPVFEKTEDQRKRIAGAVSESFMFAALSFDQLQPVIDAFQEVRVEVGTKVIEEGAEVGPDDRGLYVLESGMLDVYKKGIEKAVFTYTDMGQYFGDLALLYNAPRSATVIATQPSILWCIDRTTFNCLVKDAVQKAKERRLQFLQSVEILQTLTLDEIAKIGDSLRERSYGSGVHVIQEGTEGDVFFILEKGTAAAIKDGNRVKEYKPADYFGELALIKDAPRAADVVTLEDATVLSLNRSAFTRLLGPLDAIMKERAQSYVKQVSP
jgi:cAMP-dependent protein kinase regulator